MSLGLSAFSWGIASAVSLPLGAAIGLWWKPKRKVNSAFMAFGAGALLFALTIELFGEVPHHVHEHGMGSLVSAIVGAICGGLLFDALNSILNSKGGFLRKLSLARRYVGIKKALRKKKIIGELAKIDVLSQLPPQKMALLVQKIERRDFRKDTVIFKQGEESLDMFFLASGEVSVNVHQADGRVEEIASLGAGNTFGEIGVLGDFPRTADVVAKTNVVTYKISKDDVHDVFGKLPELKERLSKLSNERVDALDKESHQINRKWQEEAYDQLDKSTSGVTIDEIHQESHGSNAALAIWLGILIDGIPESLVIGMLAASATGMSVAFIAGVFLANLPEAMSSAVSMRAQGMKLTQIYLMWGSICILTGVGAYLGATLFPANPTGLMFNFVLGIEGLAAGAMLTMIAETMLPEAFEQGGAIVGLSTLGGFLSALVVKVL